MEKELISIIIIVYNTEQFISECIESIINQTYRNLDIVIVNDGSKDNSSQIIKKYAKKDKRINFIDRKINKGTMYTRQEGYKNAKGKYVSFVDSDDMLRNDAIEVLYNSIKETNSDVVKSNLIKYKDGKYYKNDNNYLEKKKIDKNNFEPELYDMFFKTLYLNSMCACLAKKEAMECIYKVDPKLIYAEDMLCNYYMFKNINSFYINPEELYIYRINSSSITNVVNVDKLKKKAEDSTKCLMLIYNSIGDLKLKNEVYYKELIKEKLLNSLSSTVTSCIQCVSKEEYKKIFKEMYSKIEENKIFDNYKYNGITNNNIFRKNNNKYLLKNKLSMFYINTKIMNLLKKVKNIF